MGSAVSYLSVDQKGRATLPEDVRASARAPTRRLRPPREDGIAAPHGSCPPRSYRVTSSGFTIPRCSVVSARRRLMLSRVEPR